MSLCTSLNSGVPARSSSSNRTDSTVLTTRARALQALQATLVVELVARADGVGRHVNFDPALEQVVRGLGDAHVRLDPAHDRLRAPTQIEALGAHGREDGLLDPRLVLQADLGRGMTKALRVLLADDARHVEDPSGAHQLRARLRHRLEARIGAKALLYVHHDQYRVIAS